MSIVNKKIYFLHINLIKPYALYPPKKLGFIKLNINHEHHNNINDIMTFFIIVFHLLYHDQPNAHVIIDSHAIITIKNENTIIADINIFINHCTKIGNAVTLVTLVVSHLLESVFISIQSHINGTTVFNCIQQHFLDESQIHFV